MPATSAPASTLVVTVRSQLSAVTVLALRPAIDGPTAPALPCIKTDRHAAENANLTTAATSPGLAATAVITTTLPSAATAAPTRDPAMAPDHRATGYEVDDLATPAQPATAAAPVVVITIAMTPAAAPIAKTTAARAPVLGPAIMIATYHIDPAQLGIH